jgi:hypothetical protein
MEAATVPHQPAHRTSAPAFQTQGVQSQPLIP